MSFTPDYVCTNPSCSSFGKRHPNCRCSAPGEYAQGGIVHYCTHNLPHETSCEHFADGGTLESNHEFANNPDLAVDHSVTHHGLLHTISRSGYTKSEEPGRAHAEFLDAHRRGRKSLHAHSASLLDPKAVQPKPNEEAPHALQSKLDELRGSPDLALNIGGNLADHAPLHQAVLAAKAANAMTYLHSIKPQPTQGGPLDTALSPSHAAQKAYQRQVALAENPKLIFKHVAEGTAIPQDFQTLSTLYPKLRQKMQDHAFEALADAKANGRELTYKQKRRLGVLIGEPVTLQQSPQAIQAIMQANAPEQMPQGPQKGPKKATGVELKQINKVNELSETPLQKLQTSRNS